MSVDYEYVTIDVDLMVHPKAIAAGIEAMGLWLWGVAWSHKTGANGRIPRHVVSMAWGGPPATVAKLSKRLVTSGLWLATDDGWTIWNYGKKNQSAEEKERKRELGRARMRRLRGKTGDADGDAQCDASHPRHVRDESAAPVSALVSGSDLPRSEEPRRSPREVIIKPILPANDDAPPAWWASACDTVAANVAPVDDRGARWLEYRGAMARKRWDLTREHAVSWLSQVVRRERRDAPRSRVDTRQPLTGPEPEWLARAKRTGTDGTEAF